MIQVVSKKKVNRKKIRIIVLLGQRPFFSTTSAELEGWLNHELVVNSFQLSAGSGGKR